MKKWLWLLPLCPGTAFGQPEEARAVAAFEARRWPEAMTGFLNLLTVNPGNAKAHAYIELIARAMETERRAALENARLALLQEASDQLQKLEIDPTPVNRAAVETAKAGRAAEEERWLLRCEEARWERRMGHLMAAYDTLLQVLIENGGFAEAQRELSDLQSQSRRQLDHGAGLSIPERYALEGFYAYGQADYATAHTAWQKARSVLEQSYTPADAAHRLQTLRLSVYLADAKRRVDEDKRAAELKTLFDAALTLYHEKRYVRALDGFRALAIREPGYPQLGYYLVQTEAAAEKERAAKLGEEKHRQLEAALRLGLAALEHERYAEADRYFSQALLMDPGHAQARQYLAMARAETERRNDPKAAQQHYENGLIAYASGKLDEAMREWSMTLRMNPAHEKARKAAAKVRKELALYRDVPPP